MHTATLSRQHLKKRIYQNSLRFSLKKYTCLCKTSILWPQGLQNESIEQRYSPCKVEKSNFKGEIENNFNKNQNFHSEKFCEWFGQKKIEIICFRNGFHDKSAQTDCSKEMWVPILIGLKHQNTVLGLPQYFTVHGGITNWWVLNILWHNNSSEAVSLNKLCFSLICSGKLTLPCWHMLN